MKLLKILSLFGLLSALCMSCNSIGDNLDDCGMYVNLYFEYPKFPERIHRVNVGIINEETGLFVRVRDLKKKYLMDYQGIRTRLMPGKYQAVCWGNAFDETIVEGLDFHLSCYDHWLKHPKNMPLEDPLAKPEIIQTNDSLFYGRHTFEIPEMYGVYNDTIHYRPAHITFQVYIHGLESCLPGEPTENYPIVSFDHLKPTYDYEMDTSGEEVSYYPPMEVDTDMVMTSGTTKVLRFTNENPIEVVIDEPVRRTHPDIPYTINLKKELHGKLNMIEEDKEYIIRLSVYFNGLGVEVRVQGWVGQDTMTEF